MHDLRAAMPPKLSTAVDAIQAALSRYDALLPAKLHDLDKTRFGTLPSAVAGRKLPFIEKSELVQLVEWKLRHGKFRPNLLKLAESNASDLVKKTTQDAFEDVKIPSGEDSSMPIDWTKIEAAMKKATALKGIGPATASLLLSCADQDRIPFFSDELFRFIHWDGQGDGIKPVKNGREWDRSIGYTMKEYKSLVFRIGHVRATLAANGADMRALDLEKAAWVLGKERMDVDEVVADLMSSSSGPLTTVSKASNKRAHSATDNGKDQSDPSPPKRSRKNRPSSQVPASKATSRTTISAKKSTPRSAIGQ